MFIALQKLPYLYSIAVYIDLLKKWNLTQSKPKEKKTPLKSFHTLLTKMTFRPPCAFLSVSKNWRFFHLWRHRAEFYCVDDVIVAESYF